MRVMVRDFTQQPRVSSHKQTRKSTFTHFNDAFELFHHQASSLNIAEKAGEIIRDVMQRGELGVVDKVFKSSIQRNSPRTYIKPILQTLQGENKQFDPQTEADRWVD